MSSSSSAVSSFTGSRAISADDSFADTSTVSSDSISRPNDIEVAVKSSQPQRLLISYDEVCQNGTGAGSKSGQKHVHSPGKLKIPVVHGAVSCIVSADAQLMSGGLLRISILAD